MRQMELWKQKHCRRCPYCTRVVEKLDGCDLILCGGNYHGGNQQRGCGKQFVWGAGQPNSALPYEADLRGAADYAADGAEGADGGGDEDGAMRERRLRRDAREEHQHRAGVPVRRGIGPDLGPRLSLPCAAPPPLHPSLTLTPARTSARSSALTSARSSALTSLRAPALTSIPAPVRSRCAATAAPSQSSARGCSVSTARCVST